jgi:N-acetylglucosamine kinase-like BadF-type ATPase
VGVDIGASKTEVLLLSEDKLTIDTFRLEGANYQRGGLRKIKKLFFLLRDEIFSKYSFRRVILTVGIAGVWRRNEREKIGSWIRDNFSEFFEINVLSDAEIAHYGALQGRRGILVLAGTGALSIGRDEKGWVRAGGYGYLVGDKGGAFWIGKRALEAAISSHEGWGVDTLLKDKILNHFKIKNPLDIIPRIYRRDPVTGISKLAPLVIETAKEGDGVAESILDEGAEALALYAKSVYVKLSLSDTEVKTSGGLFASLYYREKVHGFISELLGNVKIGPAEKTPSYGAALYGLKKHFGNG